MRWAGGVEQGALPGGRLRSAAHPAGRTHLLPRPLARVVALVAVLLASPVGGTSLGGADSAPKARVTATSGGLQLDGRHWWPVGFNAPQLLTRWSVNIGCGAQVDLDQFFASLPPRALTRINLFQALAINKHTGALDFSAADAVFEAAKRADQMVLPVLAPGGGACDDELFKQRQWYVDGWKKTTAAPGRAVMSFERWIRTAVDRYKNYPVVAGWELVGEPEPGVCADATCVVRSCPTDAAKVLRSFVDTAGAQVRARDPRRLIFAGFLGGGQCGTAGADYKFVGASRYLDVLDYHDYGADGVPLPGDKYNGLAVRLRQARELGKPLLVAEIGEKAGSCKTLEQRRAHIAAKMVGQRKAGSAGALLWAFVPDPRHGQCTYDIGPGDPLYAEIAAQITWGPRQ